MSDFKMDDVIGKIRSSAVRVSKEAGKLAKSTASTIEIKTGEAKLRFTLHELEEKMNNQFTAIGCSVYRSFKDNSEQEDFSEIFGRIDALDEEISQIRERLEASYDKEVCGNCGASLSDDDNFCPKCGAKVIK